MRSLLLGGALLLAGATVASAQPWFGPGWGGPPPPPPVYGWGGPPPPPPGYYGRRPPVRCWWRETYYGPQRVCRRAW